MIVLQQMTTVWFLKNMGGITMKKRIKSIGMTAGLLAVLAGCSAVQTDTDYMELRQQALDTLNAEEAVRSVTDSAITVDDENQTIVNKLWFIDENHWLQESRVGEDQTSWMVIYDGNQYSRNVASDLDTGWMKWETPTVMEELAKGDYEETMVLEEGQRQDDGTQITCSVPIEALEETWAENTKNLPEEFAQQSEKPESAQYTYYLDDEDKLTRIETVWKSTMKQQEGEELIDVNITSTTSATFEPVAREEAMQKIKETYQEAMSNVQNAAENS